MAAITTRTATAIQTGMPRRAAGVGTAAAVPEAGVRPRGGVTPPLPTEADAAVGVPEAGVVAEVIGSPATGYVMVMA